MLAKSVPVKNHSHGYLPKMRQIGGYYFPLNLKHMLDGDGTLDSAISGIVKVAMQR